VPNYTHSEHPLKIGPGRNSVENAAFHPLHASRLLARSNPSAAPQASTSGARARGFCPLLWSRGPRPTKGLRLRAPLGVCGSVFENFTANGVSGTASATRHPSLGMVHTQRLQQSLGRCIALQPPCPASKCARLPAQAACVPLRLNTGVYSRQQSCFIISELINQIIICCLAPASSLAAAPACIAAAAQLLGPCVILERAATS